MMNDNMNKTSICSVIALDVIDFSKKTEIEKGEIRSQFNHLISLAVIDIPESDRLIVDTEQGAVIACSGPLEDALEDALFISLTIRDEILKNNAQSLKPLYVQFGINLGSVSLTNKKGEADINGEGADEAKRIMSFANPNQILVSRVYHEMASKLTQDISKMFEQYDMHALEQEIYAVRLLNKDQVATGDSAETSQDESEGGGWQLPLAKINWMYAGTGVLLLVGFFALAKALLNPTEPTITMDPPVIAETPEKVDPKPTGEPVKNTEITQTTDSVQTAEPAEITEPKKSEEIAQSANTAQEEVKKPAVVKKKPTQKAVVEAKAPAVNDEKPVTKNTEKPARAATENHAPTSVAAKPAPSKAEKNTTNEKSGWQTFKDSVTSGSERKCTQAEIAMNQCAK